MDFTADSVKFREFFDRILDGDSLGKGVYRTVVMRRLDSTRLCACKDVDAGGRTTTVCPFCQGEGYMWEEEAARCYTTPGPFIPRRGDVGNRSYELSTYLEDSTSSIFWFKYDVVPLGAGDSIFILRLNSDGSVYYFVDRNGNKHPKRQDRYLITDMSKIYGDTGELAFWRVLARKDTTWLKSSPQGEQY